MKNVEQDDSENEFSVDEPEELQESEDEWAPVSDKGARRRSSRRLRNTPATQKPNFAELGSSEDDEEEDNSSSDDSDGGSKSKAKKRRLTPGVGRKRQKTGKGSSLPAVKKAANDAITTSKATPNTGTPPVATEATDKLFKPGSFVVLKTDFKTETDPPIWKRDGKVLLQKYVPFEQDGKTVYKNTPIYSGWSPATCKDLYYAAPTKFKMQNRKETLVEFLRDSVKVEKDDLEEGEAGKAESTSESV